jgi:hypothetical protein
MTPENSRAAMTPRDHVDEALHFYGAESDPENHGVSYIFLTFPDMYQAASWVRAMNLTNKVRLITNGMNNLYTFNQKVQVIYDF